MTKSFRVLIAVTHLLGVGHLARMTALARALSAEGCAVTLVSGGRPVPTLSMSGIDIVQLPPLHCRGTDFRTLLADDGRPAGDELLAERRRLLIKALARCRPDVVISELYPFGRRALAGEFAALVAAARALVPRPAILASVRDVLNPPSKPERAEQALERLARDFDAVLVHGDPAVVPLEASWPVDRSLARRIAYTGYLHDSEGPPASSGSVIRADILVSCGGSEAGEALCAAAVAAARADKKRHWHILVGHGLPHDRFLALAADAPANAVVEKARPDFRALLKQAGVSVSQAGYNTVLDLAEAAPRAVLVPFSAGSEREQTIRAESLAARGLADILPEQELSPEGLSAAIRRAATRARPDWSAIRRDGAFRSAGIVRAWAARASERHAAWRKLDGVLAVCRSDGETVPFWIRDDDAVAPSAPLERFLRLVGRHGVPVGFAVIPGGVESGLSASIRGAGKHDILVHGLHHMNHAPIGAKASEFGSERPTAALRAELAEALARCRGAVGQVVLPVFVPPWNRISEQAVTGLVGAGYRGLSVFGARAATGARTGLTVANTHWDPINWRGHRGLKDEAMLIDALAMLIAERRGMRPDEREPIGLLTHHLVHDGWVDRFLDELISRLIDSGAVRFMPAAEIFATAAADSV